MKKTVKKLPALALALALLASGSAVVNARPNGCPYTYHYTEQRLTMYLVRVTVKVTNGMGDVISSYSYEEYRG